MKIAVPTNGSAVDDHFGHCAFFTLFTIGENKEILDQEIVPSPAGCGCKSNIASVLAQKGVTVMLAGNMGDGAVRVLDKNGIQVVRGCAGDVNELTRKWAAGQIADSGDLCHQHHDGCHHE
jgi:predicted Fe-Mo cluster-binding NifX family protein